MFYDKRLRTKNKRRIKKIGKKLDKMQKRVYIIPL